MSNSLRPHELQHARPPCPSPTPRVHPNSRPSSRWCHPAISSSVVPFSSCLQSLPASESFPMSQLFTWGGQSIGVSALASFLPKNTQDWSPLGLSLTWTKLEGDNSRSKWKTWRNNNVIYYSSICPQRALGWAGSSQWGLQRVGFRPASSNKACLMWQMWFVLSQVLSQLVNHIYHESYYLSRLKRKNELQRESNTSFFI